MKERPIGAPVSQDVLPCAYSGLTLPNAMHRVAHSSKATAGFLRQAWLRSMAPQAVRSTLQSHFTVA